MPKLPTSFSSKPPWDKFSLFVHFLCSIFHTIALFVGHFLTISAWTLYCPGFFQCTNAQRCQTPSLFQYRYTHHFSQISNMDEKRYLVTWKTAGSKTGRSRQLRVPGKIIFNLIVFNRDKKTMIRLLLILSLMLIMMMTMMMMMMVMMAMTVMM